MAPKQKTTYRKYLEESLQKASDAIKAKFLPDSQKSLNMISIATGVNPVCRIMWSKYIFYVLGGSSIGKASKKFGIPKMMLSDKVNNRCPNKKPGRMTELTEDEEKSLKFYKEYMASINHPLPIPTVKAFAWSIV